MERLQDLTDEELKQLYNMYMAEMRENVTASVDVNEKPTERKLEKICDEMSRRNNLRDCKSPMQLTRNKGTQQTENDRER